MIFFKKDTVSLRQLKNCRKQAEDLLDKNNRDLIKREVFPTLLASPLSEVKLLNEVLAETAERMGLAIVSRYDDLDNPFSTKRAYYASIPKTKHWSWV